MRSTRFYSSATALACLSSLSKASQLHQDDYDEAEDDDDLDYPHPEDAGGDANPLFPGVVPPVQGQKPFEAVKGGKPQLPPLRGDRFTLGPLKFHPQEFRTEALLLALFALYALATFFLRRFNAARAKTWYTANAPILRSEFAGVGLANEALFAKDGGDEYVSYATGRRGVESAWVRLTTGGQDALAWVYEQVRGVSDAAWDSGAGKVTLDFTLSPPAGSPSAKFCFAVIRREVLKRVREERWDLRTFTHLLETPYPTFSPLLICLQESNEVTTALIKDADTGLAEAFKQGAEGIEQEWFESLVVSDLEAEVPVDGKPPTGQFHLVLTLRLPPSSRAAETQPWIELACNVADVINGKTRLLPESSVASITRRRADIFSSLAPSTTTTTTSSSSSSTTTPTSPTEQTETGTLADKRRLEREQQEEALAGMTPVERVRMRLKQREEERKKGGRERRR